MNPLNLPIVRTARDLDEINTAAKSGYLIVIQKAETNPPFGRTLNIYRNTKSGLYSQEPLTLDNAPEKWETVLGPWEYFPPRFKIPFAAYLVPTDLPVGTQVWLEDVIEDFHQNPYQEGEPRLTQTQATWNGKNFDIPNPANQDF